MKNFCEILDYLEKYSYDMTIHTASDFINSDKNYKKIDKTILRNASTYAYKFLKPRKFLEEICTKNLKEIQLFGKWEEYSDVLNWKMPNKTEINIELVPSEIIKIDENKNLSYINSKSNNYSVFPLLIKKVNSFFEIKNIVSNLIEIYVKNIHGAFGRDDRKLICVEAKKTVFNRFKHTTPSMCNILGGKIWKNIDYQSASIAVKICGNKATNLDYNIVLNNLEEIKDTLQKAPGILPVWINLAKQCILSGPNKINDIHSFSIVYFGICNITDLNYKFKNIIETTKNYLEHNFSKIPYNYIKYNSENISNQDKITSGEWRTLINIPITSSRRIMIMSHNLSKFIATLRFFNKTGVPRHSLITPIINNIVETNNNNTTMESLVKSCVNHIKKKRNGVKNFWYNEASLVLDWIRNSNINLDKNQSKASWSWFMKKQEEWHIRQQIIKNENLKNTKWESKLDEFQLKEYTIVPLTSSLMLFDEGKDMKHCVSSYSDKCLSDKSRIFSIRIKNTKTATIEIVKFSSNKWEVGQVRGIQNSKVDDKISTIAKIITEKYNKQD